MFGHNSGTSQLDFDGNPDMGFFEGIYHCGIRGCLSWVLQQFENTQASGPQVEQIIGCLGSALRSPSASNLILTRTRLEHSIVNY